MDERRPCCERKPDHRLELTEKGKQQARDAGEKLRELLGGAVVQVESS